MKNSICDEYKEARYLIQRIECKLVWDRGLIRRDLYPFVGEVIINSKAFKDVEELIPLGSSYGKGRGERLRVDRSRIEKAIVTELEAEAKINHLAFDSHDLVIDIVKLSLGMGVEYLIALKL